MLVAIDTATRFASIALYEPGRVLAEYTWQSGNNHTVEMMPSLVEMIERQDMEMSSLQAIAVAIGPGSFTGLRIGLSVAKGLAMGLDIPLVGVPTLEILPYAVGQPALPIWSVIQAGRGRLCYAEYTYQEGKWEPCTDLEVGTIEQLVGRLHDRSLVCGELSPADRAQIEETAGTSVLLIHPAFSLRRAAYLADLGWQRLERGEHDDVVSLSPLYIHHPENTTRA